MTKKSATAGVSPIDQDTINRVNDAHKKLKDAKQSLKTVMQGQDELIDLALATVISGAGGHILFEGRRVPVRRHWSSTWRKYLI